MKLFTFASIIAFVAFQVGVTAKPIPDPMPVPEVATPGLEEDVRRDRYQEGIAILKTVSKHTRPLQTNGTNASSLLVYRSGNAVWEADVEGLVGNDVSVRRDADVEGDTRRFPNFALTAEPVGRFNLGDATLHGAQSQWLRPLAG
ncbi:hypothetical protein C8R45DRAFT_927373 [Mycena sanguinolenta]|nr:hypothetical protein C8R45DRAFT_927373 [Mycena sanguinolenta]